MNKISNLPAHKARNLIGQKKLSSTELVKSCIEQYEKHNPNINAIVAINQKDVLEQAKKCDEKVSKGETLGLLHGLPVGIKDLQMVKNLRSTYGSLLFKNYIPKHDDNIVKNSISSPAWNCRPASTRPAFARLAMPRVSRGEGLPSVWKISA